MGTSISSLLAPSSPWKFELNIQMSCVKSISWCINSIFTDADDVTTYFQIGDKLKGSQIFIHVHIFNSKNSKIKGRKVCLQQATYLSAWSSSFVGMRMRSSTMVWLYSPRLTVSKCFPCWHIARLLGKINSLKIFNLIHVLSIH